MANSIIGTTRSEYISGRGQLSNLFVGRVKPEIDPFQGVEHLKYVSGYIAVAPLQILPSRVFRPLLGRCGLTLNQAHRRIRTAVDEATPKILSLAIGSLYVEQKSGSRFILNASIPGSGTDQDYLVDKIYEHLERFEGNMQPFDTTIAEATTEIEIDEVLRVFQAAQTDGTLPEISFGRVDANVPYEF